MNDSEREKCIEVLRGLDTTNLITDVGYVDDNTKFLPHNEYANLWNKHKESPYSTPGPFFEWYTPNKLVNIYPTSVVFFVDECSSAYEDGGIGVSGCVELYLIHDIGYDKNEAYELSLSLSTDYFNATI